jgi:RNA polymerase sigma-70 factor (ECF subfamily)
MNSSGPIADNSADFAQLLAAARSGDRVAVGTLLEQHSAYLRAIAERELDESLQAKESPSDLTQKTFLEAHRGIGEFRGATEGEFRQWLASILTHNLADVGRRFQGTRKRAVGRELRIQDDAGLRGDDPSPSAPVRKEEQDDQLQLAIQRLPDNYRRVIEFRHHANLEFAEIGTQLGVSAEAARKLWTRAIDRLRDELNQSDAS